jgi:hypothetical protein
MTVQSEAIQNEDFFICDMSILKIMYEYFLYIILTTYEINK